MTNEYVYELTETEYKTLLHLAQRAHELDVVLSEGDAIGIILRQMDLSAALTEFNWNFSPEETNRFG